jgi:hypothetical protein
LFDQGSLTEGEYQLVYFNSFLYGKYYLLFYKTCYQNEEVNCTETSLAVRVPWFDPEFESKIDFTI